MATKAPAEIKIESGVPVPAPKGTGVSAALRKLKVGQSFTVSINNRPSIRAAAHRLGLRVTVRTVDDKTVRVWRAPDAEKAKKAAPKKSKTSAAVAAE